MLRIVPPVQAITVATLTALVPAPVRASENPPYPTGAHLQLSRELHTTAQGLPSDDVRAVAVARDGSVFAAAGAALARLDGARWVDVAEPAGAAALHGAVEGADALAGAPDGVWSLSGGAWRRDAGSPQGAFAFSAEPDGTPWALAPSGAWRRPREAEWTLVNDFERLTVAPRGLCPMGPEDVYLATENGLFALMGKRKYWLSLEVRPGGLLSEDVRAVARLDEAHLLAATDKGLSVSNGERGWLALRGEDGLPILDLTRAACAPDGAVWLGSGEGLIRWRGGAWTYLAGKRWLPDDRVTAIAPAPDGSVWVGTRGGLSHIVEKRTTLAEKAAAYQRTFEARDHRHGFVAQMMLPAPGALEGALQEVSDNDGLRTGLYVASQAYRWAVTKEPEARAQASRSLKALLRLESITGIPGFPARAICREDEPQARHRSLRSDSEWHPSPVEAGWWWKGETSSDELDGHFFAFHVFFQLAAEGGEKEVAKEKEEVRAACRRIMDHILDHGYYLVDADGKPTTWGAWAPEKLNDDPKWWEDRGLNSLEILSHLKVASRIVGGAAGEPRYESAYRELIRKHHYALNAVHTAFRGAVSHDGQLAFLAFYPLLQLERDPALRVLYETGLRRAWEIERPEANPLFNFILGASTGGPCDVEGAVKTLREMPLDLITWRVRNSHRADLRWDPALLQRGVKRLAEPLPLTERGLHYWDHSPFELDQGADRGEMDPTIWLLPYWLGRHHRLIE